MDRLKISLNEIKQATNSFDDKYRVGSGGYGEVYKAELDIVDFQSLSSKEGKCKDEQPKRRKIVAIKRIFSRDDGQGTQGFLREIELLTSCKHQNIVSLLGFARENDEMILVYEFALNGSLGDYLRSNDKMVHLTWAQRLQICLDTANGINYLHTNMEGKQRIIHRDIKSDNILLNENLNAKVADFGLSKFHPMKQQATNAYSKVIVGTEVYIDPEYLNTLKYTIETDIYSFGVVLFEVLCGRLAYDSIYTSENRMGLAPIARRRFRKGKIKEMIDPKLIEEVQNDIFALNRGLHQDPFYAYSKIAYQCLAETQANRPTMEVIIEELQNALNLQELKSATNNFSTILSATNHFSYENLITEGTLGKVYKGQLLWNGNLMNFTLRRLDCKYVHGDELQTEVSTLKRLQHKNIISGLGYYDENNEKIIIYEQAFHGTLDQHLSNPTLTWSQRLQICLGVARALKYIHYDVIHCDINSSKVFLDENWQPKIYGFELSTKYPQSWRHRLLYSHYLGTNNMTPKYDVYTFGVLLLEVICGRKPMITNDGVVVELDQNIHPDLRKQMDRQSLALFKNIAYNCLNQQPVKRPTMDQIVKELEEVLELQWKHENLEHDSRAAADDKDTSSNSMKLMNLLKISLMDIRVATNNFDDTYCVGYGGFGMVYKAALDVFNIQSLSSMEGKCIDEHVPIRRTVAIKRMFSRADEQGKQGFLTEIELLASCKHPNIVSLLGFSREAREMILVYEYAFKGSLSDYLKGSDKTTAILTWAQRIQICLDIANGINYLHTNMEGKPRIIHRDIKSENILLDENLKAMVADFGFSKFHPMKRQASAIHTKNIAGTEVYMDPEYLTTFKYKKESDIYSFGVVLFEVLSGSLAYDSVYTNENVLGLASIARRHFNEGTLKELIDAKITEEDGDHFFTLNRGPNQDSFEAFSKIAYQCLAETQARRPTIEDIIKGLQNALNLHGETVVLSRFQLSDILLATENFAETNRIGLDTIGMVYKAELHQVGNNSSLATEAENNVKPSKKCITVAIKRITSRAGGQGKQELLEEIEMCGYKHPNIVSILGFCDEGDETILVYEYASNRSLDDYLKSVDNMDSFSWTNRLHMCLEIARGLNHLHTKIANPQRIIHNDIKSANIMLDKNQEAKIAPFGISMLHPKNQEVGIKVYEDPKYEKTGKLKSDIYSFGVVLFEIFCGRVAYDPVYIVENDKGLAAVARHCLNDGTIESIMDPRLKELETDETFTSNRGPNQDSLNTFLKIAYECLGEVANRPTMEMVIKELERALKFHDPQGHGI